MASYWQRQAYEAKKNAAVAQTSALTPEAPISFAGMGQMSVVPSLNSGYDKVAYEIQKKSTAAIKTPAKKPKAEPKPKKANPYAGLAYKNRKQEKKYTSKKLKIETTYSEPKNTETIVAKSNTGRIRVPKNVGLRGKSSLVIKKN
jgi:hypothetical protein